MAEVETPSRRIVVDAIVLAFSASKLRDVVGTDALRTVLDVEFKDMVESGSLDLQILWELLEEQPGFDAALAAPPICVIKGWEDKLRIPVDMPDALAGLSERDRALQATECPVPPGAARKVFETAQQRAARISAAEQRMSGDMTVPRPSLQTRATKLGWRERRVTAVIAGVVLLGAASYLGLAVSRMGGKDWQSVKAGEFAGEMPIANAKQFGAQMGATLTDGGWLTRPEADRRAHMETAMKNLSARNVRVLFVRDASGVVRASTQWHGTPPILVTRFY
jgi:hypothetical protein